MLSVVVNGVPYIAAKGVTVLQFCLNNGINIPSFCYHERLNISGNCRMCLVEVKGLPKPIESCTMLLQDNMNIFTDTPFVKKAQENIMESLLYMHPLDCPICDQGGECDLQDQAYFFGADRGRFYSSRRYVLDKNCGFFIKTVMTRCIHCTRCVRFSSEICNTPFFGTLKRGSSTEISYYKSKPFRSEISGNVIDLCPVGALTSKPHSFIGRPWEDSFEANSYDFMDPFGSSISILSTNTKIIKIIPRLQNSVNKEWISDRIRFCYDSLDSNRLTIPYHKFNSYFHKFDFYNKKKYFFKKYFLTDINYISNTLVDFNFFYNLYNFNYVSNSLFFPKKFRNLFFFNYNLFSTIDFRSSFVNFFFLDDLLKYDSYFLFSFNLKNDFPIVNSYLNQYAIKKSNPIFLFGNVYSTNLNYKHIGLNFTNVLNFFKGKHIFSNVFFDLNSSLILSSSLLTDSFFFKENLFFKNFFSFFLGVTQNFCFYKRFFNLNFYNFNNSLQDSSLVELGLSLNHNIIKLFSNFINYSLNSFFFNSSLFFYNFSFFNTFKFKNKFLKFFGFLPKINNNIFFRNVSNLYFSTHGINFNSSSNKPDYLLPLSSFFERSVQNFFMYFGYCGKRTSNHFLSSSMVNSELYYLNLNFNLLLKNRKHKKKLKFNNSMKIYKKNKLSDFNLNFNFNVKDNRLFFSLRLDPNFFLSYGLNSKRSFFLGINEIVHSKNIVKGNDMFLKLPLNI
jgi:hypothetical protein